MDERKPTTTVELEQLKPEDQLKILKPENAYLWQRVKELELDVKCKHFFDAARDASTMEDLGPGGYALCGHLEDSGLSQLLEKLKQERQEAYTKGMHDAAGIALEFGKVLIHDEIMEKAAEKSTSLVLSQEFVAALRAKLKSVLGLALATGLRADTRVDEVVAENAQEMITMLDEETKRVVEVTP